MTKAFFTMFLVGGILALMAPGSTALAAVVATGDVSPPYPWPTTTNPPVDVIIGNTADGAVLVDAGSEVNPRRGATLLGFTPGVTGTLTVDGVGSTWIRHFSLPGGISAGTSSLPNVFGGGTGIVNITNGGVIHSDVGIGNAFNSTGFLNITNGGRLYGGGSLGVSLGSTGIAIVDGVGSQWSGPSHVDHPISGNGGGIEIGSRGTGLLKILNGASVISTNGTVGRFETGTGRVIVDGPGSTWAIGASQFTVGGGLAQGGLGDGGRGLVTVTNGATLSNQGMARVGYHSRAVGTVMVHGTGSSWTSGTDLNGSGTGCSNPFPFSPVCGLNVGVQGIGNVSVSDGATLTTNALYINNQSRLTVDLGTGSSVTVTGDAGLTNDGTIRMAAKATAANGTYAPISASSWTGSGTVQALGGVYDPGTHSVTVSTAATGQAGVATTIDRSTTQRILITDAASGKSAGASFQATTVPTNLSLTASLMNNSQLSLLQGLLDPGKTILSGWNFSATGYQVGDPVYLSLEIGPGHKFYELDLWHFDGTGWDKFLNTDLAYDNQFASFVVTGFSGYAVSGVAPVPVPAAIWLFGSGLAAMVGFARRNRKSLA